MKNKIKNLLKDNFKYYQNILILSIICSSIHIFICNFGGIYKFIISQENSVFDILKDLSICGLIFSLATSILFSINIFITRIFIFICNFVGAIYTYFVLHQGIIINEQIIISAIFFPEGNDFYSSFDFIVFFYVIPIIILSTFLIYFLEKKLKIKSIFSYKIHQISKIFLNNFSRLFYGLILVIILLAPFYKNIFILTFKLRTVSEQMMPSFVFAQYKEIILMHKISQKVDLKGYENYNYQISNPSKKDEPTIAVIVVGESLRSDRLGLNGYNRNTTPQLAKISNLLNFKNVLSCATTTSASLLCMLTDEEQDGWIKKYSSASYEKKYSVAKVIKDQGFTVKVLSTANKDSSIYIYKDFHAPDKIIMASELRKKYMSKFDDYGDLLLLQEVNSDVENPTLYVLGTRGSHREYYMNYTRDFAKFEPDIGHSLEEINNSYDNSVLYFDNFMSKLIEKLQDKNAIIFYVSDHGESLGENNVFLHGAILENAPKEQRMVPMMIWMSEKYKNNNKKNYLNLKNNNLLHKNDNLNIKHDHFFHTILGCLNIKSKNNKNFETLNLCGDKAQ
jgi:glucan phosphoethanolaminetransferase (alkaline phosphatase superfamily)